MATQQMHLASWSVTCFSSMTYLSKQLVAELRAAFRFNPNPGAKPKSSDTKTDFIYKRAFSTTCSRCMFCGLYFPPPVWCTNGGAYKIAIILAPRKES